MEILRTVKGPGLQVMNISRALPAVALTGKGKDDTSGCECRLHQRSRIFKGLQWKCYHHIGCRRKEMRVGNDSPPHPHSDLSNK